jgi:hypothetical protein
MAKEPNPIVQLAKKMNQPVDFPGIDNAKTTLREALDTIAKRYDVGIDFADAALPAGSAERLSFMNRPVAETPLPKRSHVRLGTVLQRILDRLPERTRT